MTSKQHRSKFIHAKGSFSVRSPGYQNKGFRFPQKEILTHFNSQSIVKFQWSMKIK